MRKHSPAILQRRGTIIPFLALAGVALFAMVALAIDMGLIALARNHAQNAADVAAMGGVRVLTGEKQNDNNKAGVRPAAEAAASANHVAGQPLPTSNLATTVGYYAYNNSLKRFEPNFSGSKPSNESWSAVQATVTANQPTYFARLFGYTSMPVAATATAVHRPRDIALVLDFSGSMKFSSEPCWPSSGNISGSLNPDPAYPKFGHWSQMSSVMQRTSLYVDGGGETHAPNNLSIETENGPPIVRDFLTRDGSGALINAFHRPASPYNAMTWATPAPSDFDVQSDTTATYVGDKWPRYNKSFSSGSYARTVQEFLFGNNNSQSNTHSKSTTTGPSGGRFDPLDPNNPQTNEGYGTNFKGYSMGPGYYGKTFYVWPPDPRYHPTNNALQLDWRKKFFFRNGTSDECDDNSALWDSSGYWKQAGQSGSYTINYNAVVAWLKSGPKVLPDNLRAGRVLYYSAIPDSIPSSGGTLDQRFWREYIDYVLGAGSSTEQSRTLYGRHTSSWGTIKITPKSSLNSNSSNRPYMHYNDNPMRPRMHFWFGPLSMLNFITEDNASGFGRNWWPGTCREAQCWQLKAGIQSALADIEKNHPNDWVTTIYFSALTGYNSARVRLGRDYVRMRNALYFPYSLLDQLDNPNAEIRPYNSSFSSTANGNVPNSYGGTSPEMGFMVAYNEFSNANGGNGRRGATKMVVFETDGVPNTTSNGSFVKGSPPAYNSYYSSISNGSGMGNNNSTVTSRALSVLQQICNLESANNPGYATSKQPVRVHALAFGDLFQSNSGTKAQALDFLLDVQKIGKTSSGSANQIESYKIIVGDYDTRIENLRQALERIMQSGVQVSLIR